jgi:hypothetical protein
MGKIHLAKLIIIPLIFSFFFSFFPLTLFHSGVILMDQFYMVNLLPQKNCRDPTVEACLFLDGNDWPTFIVDLDRPSDLSFGRCDKEWDANWSRGSHWNFSAHLCFRAEYSIHQKNLKIVLYFQRFSKMYFKLKAGRRPEKVQGQIHLLGYRHRFFWGGLST